MISAWDFDVSYYGTVFLLGNAVLLFDLRCSGWFLVLLITWDTVINSDLTSVFSYVHQVL